MDDTGAPVGLENLFGAMLRAFRRGGLRESAAKIPINFSHLAKWERGERPVPDEMVSVLDQAYAANGTLITLHELIKRDRLRTTTDAAKTLWRTVPTLLPGDGDDGRRRSARRLFPAISAATGTPVETLEALEAAEELATGLRSAVEQRDGIRPADWDRVVGDRALSHCTGHPGTLLGRLTVDCARLSRLLGQEPASATVQSGLLRAAARLAALLALQWTDAGQPDLADRYWELSRTAADGGGDRDTRVWVRAQQAHSTYWAGRPPLPVAALAEDAVHLAGGTPGTGLALAYATAALLAAGRGDADGTHAALDEFDPVADRLPADGHALPLWDLPAWTHAYHRAWPSLLLGDTTSAAQAITEAEKLCPPHFPGHAADLRLYRACLLIAEGDIDQGLNLTRTAAHSCPLTANRRHILAHLLTTLPPETHPTTQPR